MPKRIGRPPLDPDSPTVNVTVRLPARQVDALYRLASAKRTTISELMRRSIRPRPDPGRDEDE